MVAVARLCNARVVAARSGWVWQAISRTLRAAVLGSVGGEERRGEDGWLGDGWMVEIEYCLHHGASVGCTTCWMQCVGAVCMGCASCIVTSSSCVVVPGTPRSLTSHHGSSAQCSKHHYAQHANQPHAPLRMATGALRFSGRGKGRRWGAAAMHVRCAASLQHRHVG